MRKYILRGILTINKSSYLLINLNNGLETVACSLLIQPIFFRRRIYTRVFIPKLLAIVKSGVQNFRQLTIPFRFRRT